MVNYSNGKIYKIEPIIEHDENDIFIGSTTKQYLSQRMENHRSSYKSFKNQNKNKLDCSLYTIFDKYGVENCRITLIEKVNVQTKDELLAKENYYIQNNKCINKLIPAKTKKELILEKQSKQKELCRIYLDSI